MKGYLYFIFAPSLFRIGKTVNIVRRVKEYSYLDYNEIMVIECPADSMSLYERKLIAKFKPVGNYQFNDNRSENINAIAPIKRIREGTIKWEKKFGKYLIKTK